MKKHLSEIVRYFLTYLCVLIPFVILCTLLIRNSYQVQRNETQNQLQQYLEKAADEMDAVWSSYNSSALSLFRYKGLVQEKVFLDNTETVNTISVLSFVLGGNSNTKGIFVYYPTYDTVYCNYGKSILSTYLRETLGLSAVDRETVEQALSGSETCCIPVYSRYEQYLFCHFSGKDAAFSNILGRNVSVNYLLNLSRWKDGFRILASGCPVYLEMVFEGGEDWFFYCTSDGVQLMMPEEQEQLDFTERYTILEVPGTKILFRTYYDSRRLFAATTAKYVAIALVAILMLTLAFVLCYFFSRKRYEYLRSLQHLVQPSQNRRITEQGMYDQIHLVVRDRETQRRRQCSELLFHGLLKEPSQIEKRFSECGLDPESTAYILVLVPDPEETLQVETILEEHNILCCENEVDGRRTLHMLFQFSEEEDTDSYEQKVRMVVGKMSVFLGDVFHELTDVFLESMKLVFFAEHWLSQNENSFSILGQTVVLKQQKEGISDSVPQLDAPLLTRLNKYLKKKDDSQSQQILELILQDISQKEHNLQQRRFLRYSLINEVINSFAQGENGNSMSFWELTNLDVDSQEFMIRLSSIITSYCENTEEPDVIDLILDYIEENYMHYDISLNEIAERFQLNRTFLSNTFHKKTGYTYMNFLTRLRMNKARDMLLSTSLTVKEITEMVGYIDETYFRKRFREFFGMNPSEVRNKKEEETI